MLCELVPALADQYADMAAVAAADWYDQVRSTQVDGQLSDGFHAQPDPGVNVEALQRRIRWKAGVLWEREDTPADSAGMLTWLHQSLEGQVRNASRRTVRTNTRRDPSGPRYARVPGGATPCAFCIMLASRGYAYASEDTADFGNRFHDGNCRCQIVPEWGPGSNRITYDQARYERIYQSARDALESGNIPASLREGLERISPYQDPRGSTVYGPLDPNNVNSLTYLMRHMHPTEVGQGTRVTPRHQTRKRRRSTGGMLTPLAKPGQRIRELLTMSPRHHLSEVTHKETNPMWDQWVAKKAAQGAGFNTGSNPWAVNCQRVVQAAELRLRGYDVQAVGSHPHSSDGSYWNISDMWVDREGRHRRFTRRSTNQDTVDAMLAFPEGSRFFVAGPWNNGGAHVWNAEIIRDSQGKRLRMVDLQAGDYTAYGYESDAKTPDQYVSHIRDGQLQFLRVDDLEPTDMLLEGGRPDYATGGIPYAKPWVGDAKTAASWSEWKLKRTQWSDAGVWRLNRDEYEQWPEATPPKEP